MLSKLPAAAAATATAAALGAAGLATVDGLEGAIVGGAVRQEGGALHLLDVVEAGDADEALREGRGARADLLEDLFGGGAAVHGELPHHPVAVVVVTGVDGVVNVGPAVRVSVRLVGGLELDAGGPAVVEEVLHLAGDLLVGEGGEEGESFEEPGGGGGGWARLAVVFRKVREAEKHRSFISIGLGLYPLRPDWEVEKSRLPTPGDRARAQPATTQEAPSEIETQTGMVAKILHPLTLARACRRDTTALRRLDYLFG